MSDDLKIDEQLLAEAQRLGQHGTKQEAITAALNEYVTRRKQLEIVEIFGTVEYEPNYDYKEGRRARQTKPGPHEP